MILDVLNQYWIVYGMLGILGIGVLSRLWLNHIYKSLLRDTRNLETPRKKLLKKLKKQYESYSQTKRGLRDTNAFIKKNLYSQKFLGMTIDGIKRISGQALFLCLLVGFVAGIVGYRAKASEEVIGIHIGVGISCAVVLLDVMWLFNAKRKQEVLEIGLFDYIENYLANAREKEREETVTEKQQALKRKVKSAPPRAVDADIQELKRTLQHSRQAVATKEYVPSKTDGEVVEEVIHEFLG